MEEWRQQQQEQNKDYSHEVDDNQEEDDLDQDDDDDDYVPHNDRQSHPPIFDEYGCACIDQQVSTNQSVILGNALLDCLRDYLHPSLKHYKLNYDQLRRLKDRLREEANKEHLEMLRNTTITSLYLDSKIDISLVVEKNQSGTYTRKLVAQNHYSVIAEPGAMFITTVTVEKPTKEIVNKDGKIEVNYLIQFVVSLFTPICVYFC